MATGMDAEETARQSAALGDEKADVIRKLMREHGLSWVDATQLVTREYLRQRRIEDQNAADAEFNTD
jgi:hypothetical protein